MNLHLKNGPELLLDEDLKSLREKLVLSQSADEKLQYLKEDSRVNNFLEEDKWAQILDQCSQAEKIVCYSLLVIGQFQFFSKPSLKEMQKVIKALLPVEEFYSEIGGIIGYHSMCLELLDAEDVEGGRYHPPRPIDISTQNQYVRDSIVAAIKKLDVLAELYPIGGAADRLSLQDEKTGEFQIAATLSFCGKTLLHQLIEDVQAREYLHFKIFDKQISVPLGLMTSNEKWGDWHVREMLKELGFFGKREEDFFVFSQPLVPAMNSSGKWCMDENAAPLLKPGGHGVIWKLAKDLGFLQWLKEKKKSKVFVRQINNPIAGIDYGLLAFMGIGIKEDRSFGFASCPRMLGVSEGVNVVIEKAGKFSLTNIEYCSRKLSQVNEEEEPFLANTNLLFVDVHTIEDLVSLCPIPGMLINVKKVKTKKPSGKIVEEEVLRLESTMQNLADALQEEKGLSKNYITSNTRIKTISTIKKEFAFGSSMTQTPEQCYLDRLENSRDLLVNYCNFKVPELRDSGAFFVSGPSFVFFYHPALGPLYEVIDKKLVGGRLAMNSELNLQIADIYMENLDIDGSLSVSTDTVIGHFDEKGILTYSNQTGKCILKNVRIRNLGINREASRSFWKEEIVHREKCEIFIEEGGEFYAEDLVLRGDLRICVPSGVKVIAKSVNDQLKFEHVVLNGPSWQWKYSLGSNNQIHLERR